MTLQAFVLRRVVNMLLLLFFVMTLNFLIFIASPGDPMTVIVGSRLLTTQQREDLIELYGLREPIWSRYIKYLRNMLTWQFGYSYYSLRPVSDEIMERLPNTILLMGVSLLISIAVGVVIGVYAAARRGKFFDVAAITGSLITYSLPTFWMGLVFLFLFGYQLGLFPLAGTMSRPPPSELFSRIGDLLWHLFLPALTLFLYSYGGWALLTRSTMLEVLSEEYIWSARAKGVSERTILFKHALRNALLPLVTNAAVSFGFLVSGAILTEQVFSWHGIGSYTWNAIQYNDYPVLQAVFYITAICVILANFAADIVYGLVDPRVKY